MRARGRLAAALTMLFLLAACGGAAAATPDQLLRDARASIDNARAVHFTLTSQGAQGGGTLVTGGSGDARRPQGFSGTLDVVALGLPFAIGIVSVNGVLYARTPLSSGYTRVDPSSYGFGDPSRLLDPTQGLSSLLTACSGARFAPSDRLAGELLDEVTCSMPGDRVAHLLTSADPSVPVRATVGVTDGGHQLRRVTLTGPFFARGHDSTFTVVLDRYGENVSITQPPAAG